MSTHARGSIGEHDGKVYFAMDLVDGKPLDELIDDGDLAHADSARIVEQAARGRSARFRPMPITQLIDPADYDPTAIVVSRDAIREVIPQRGNWEQLDGLLLCDAAQQLAVGVRHVPEHPFWEEDHMPGKPLLPGALMLDALAQLGIYYHHTAAGEQRLFGFGGLQDVSFRRPVRPGETILYAVKPHKVQSRKVSFFGQGYVDGKCVVDAIVIGVPILARG